MCVERTASSGSKQHDGILDRPRTGDECAELLAVLESHQDRLYNYLLSMLLDGDDAQDCLQDTFLRAYEQSPRVRYLWPLALRWLATGGGCAAGQEESAGGPADLAGMCATARGTIAHSRAHDLLSILPPPRARGAVSLRRRFQRRRSAVCWASVLGPFAPGSFVLGNGCAASAVDTIRRGVAHDASHHRPHDARQPARSVAA
jgi:hypothetical protein